jgi:cyanoexosortase A
MSVLDRFATQDRRFWLGAIAAGLVAVHLTLAWRVDDTNLLFSSLIFWSATASLIWQKRHQLTLKTDIVAVLVGVTLLVAALVQSLPVTQEDDILYIYPAIVGLGIALLASGLRGLRDYWRELLLLFFLGVPEVILSRLLDPGELTARFAHTLLWYSGFDAIREGIVLHLPDGSVEVTQDCSGLRAMTRLLSMAILSLIWLPRRWSIKEMIGLPILAILIAFVFNGVRVVLLALLVAHGYRAAFESLHGGSTSQLFSIISILIFMSVVWQLIQIPATSDEEEVEPS